MRMPGCVVMPGPGSKWAPCFRLLPPFLQWTSQGTMKTFRNTLKKVPNALPRPLSSARLGS